MWMWLVDTNKGQYLVEVMSNNWTQAEALKRVMQVFEVSNMEVQQMKVRKLLSGDPNKGVTLFDLRLLEAKQEEGGLDFKVVAGEQFWRAAGRGAEYEAEKVLMGKQLRTLREPARKEQHGNPKSASR